MKEIHTIEFNSFLKDIKSKIYSAKSKAILSANRLMIKLYLTTCYTKRYNQTK